MTQKLFSKIKEDGSKGIFCKETIYGKEQVFELTQMQIDNAKQQYDKLSEGVSSLTIKIEELETLHIDYQEKATKALNESLDLIDQKETAQTELQEIFNGVFDISDDDIKEVSPVEEEGSNEEEPIVENDSQENVDY